VPVKDNHSLTKEQKDIVKGLTIVINRLHLRFEDDYYSGEKPYSFGLVIEVSFSLSLGNIKMWDLSVGTKLRVD